MTCTFCVLKLIIYTTLFIHVFIWDIFFPDVFYWTCRQLIRQVIYGVNIEEFVYLNSVFIMYAYILKYS